MTADTNLSARLDLARMRYDATETGYALDDLRILVFGAWQSGQLITLADAEAMVSAERDACSAIADAYAEENITMAGDSVIFDPVLSSKRGDVLAPSDFRKSEELMMSGAIHSSMFHAAQNIAAAIRARGVTP